MRKLTGLLLLILIVPGCSASTVAPPKLYPVKGNLKIDGKPAEGVTVSLMPVESNTNGRPGVGTPDAEGNFIIRTNGDRGATVGQYKVVLGNTATQDPKKQVTVEEATKMSGAGIKFGGPPPPKYSFPSEWASPLTTPKTVDVTDKGLEFNIDI
jgi:hypothetical protein